jgi:hypothetical protein
MNRLIVGSLVSVPLFVTMACSGDPTDSLRNGIAQVNASPSQLFVQVGRTSNVDATATDEQGNLISTSFQATSIGGSTISVIRDTTFQPIFVNDTQAVAPAEAATFRFKVTANALGVDTVTITSGDVSTRVPVAVTRDPAVAPPFITVASTGPTAADTTTLTLAPPYAFPEDVAVSFDAGDAIVVERSPDGSSLKIFPPPGATTVGTAVVGLSYLPTDTATTTTDVPLTISTSVPSRPGTDDITTAPDITPASGSTAFYDGAAFTGTDLSGDCDPTIQCPANAQYYKFTVPAHGDVDLSVNWSNDADIDLVLCNDVTCSVPDFTNATGDQPQGSTYTLTAGTYYIDVVLFDGTKPDWISINLALH